MTEAYLHVSFNSHTAIKLIFLVDTGGAAIRIIYRITVICYYFSVIYTNIIPKLNLQMTNPTHAHFKVLILNRQLILYHFH